MAKRPTPKNDVIVMVNRSLRELRITALSDDARQWIADNATWYGQLITGQRDGEFRLFVDPNWDLDEVIDWIKDVAVEDDD